MTWNDKSPDEIVEDINFLFDVMPNGGGLLHLVSRDFLREYIRIERPHVHRLFSAAWRAGMIVNGYAPK